MAAAAILLVVLLTVAGAIRQLRENRRRGIKIEWSKTAVTGAGCILITAAAVGAMLGAAKLGQPEIGFVAFLVVFGVGLAGLIIFVNRRWPRRS
jgi:hypothetical protein